MTANNRNPNPGEIGTGRPLCLLTSQISQSVATTCQILLLMMVLKCFNLPSSSPPTRSSEKERIRGSGPVSLEQLCLRCLEIGSSVHRLTAAPQSTHKHFMDTPAIHFSRTGIANMNQQRWHYLPETVLAQIIRRDQKGCQEFSVVPLLGKQRYTKI